MRSNNDAASEVTDAVAAAAGAAGLALAGESILVAVSGGIDSSVLMCALDEARAEHGWRLAVGHVNHGLRGAESDADEAHVKDLAHALGLPILVRRVAPRALQEGEPSRTRPTLQEAARRARYDALAEMAQEAEATRIATAHTLDDQAETVLLRLLRGAGPDALGGIPERSPDGRIVRPLLGVSRNAIERFARERHLSFREDPSNRDPQYARARLRQAGFDRIAADQNPKWLRAIGELAEAQRRDSEWIAEIVEQEAGTRFFPEREGLRIRADGWDAIPLGLARRLAREALRRTGGGRDVSKTHVRRVVEFLRSARPGKTIELPGGRTLTRERDAFRLRSDPPAAPDGSPSEC